VGKEAVVAGNPFREMIEQPSDRVIVALDNMTWDQAEGLMSQVDGQVGMGKINSLAQRKGWEHAINTLTKAGSLTMADAKFHDIPATVGLHVKEVAQLGPAFITVHASGGKAMLEAAVQAAEEGDNTFNTWLDYDNPHEDDPRLYASELSGILAITVLTSLDGKECKSIFGAEPEQQVMQFAEMALDAGVDGIVCSGQELRAIRSLAGYDDLITVVPGITPEWAQKAGDQKRVVTPAEAVELGADFIVVGRAITQPPEGISPREAAERINAELKGTV
jgi:orotidine-5'-phosphate decarboxylase